MEREGKMYKDKQKEVQQVRLLINNAGLILAYELLF